MELLGALNKGDKGTWEDQDDFSDQPTRKTRTVGSSTMESQKRELNTLKLVAQQAQTQRIIMSIIVWTISLPTKLVSKPLQVAKDFTTRHKGQSNHRHGSPHVHVWRAVIQAILEAAQELPSCAELKQATDILKKALQDFTDSGPKKGHLHIRQCRVRTCREEEKGLLIYQLSHLLEDPRQVDLAIHYLVNLLGGEVLEGTAPPNALERQLGKDIEELKVAVGDTGRRQH